MEFKEKLYGKLIDADRNDRDIFGVLDEFFSNHVVIPKGANRHKFADICHQALETSEVLQIRFTSKTGWFNALNFSEAIEYRIRPESVYEWQYQDGFCRTIRYYTDEESNKFKGQGWLPIEETKRLRITNAT